MGNLDFLAPASLLMNGLLITVLIALGSSIVEAAKQIASLTKENVELRRAKPPLSTEQLIKMIALTTKPTPVFDSKTKSLLNLAVSKTNENEARAAAMEACKRIHKTINK